MSQRDPFGGGKKRVFVCASSKFFVANDGASGLSLETNSRIRVNSPRVENHGKISYHNAEFNSRFFRIPMNKGQTFALSLITLLCIVSLHSQPKKGSLLQPVAGDESVTVAVDKPVYFPGDTVRLTIRREDSRARDTITPIVTIEGTALQPAGKDEYVAVLPPEVLPGSYPVRIKIVDSQNRSIVYQTDCDVLVEEFQAVERIGSYVNIGPESGSIDPSTAVTLERDQIRNLLVTFQRTGIRWRMGPQFVVVKTSVQARDGSTVQSFERRALTFRSHGEANKDRVLFVRYRMAYGTQAAIRTEELDRIRVQVDSLPDWGLVRIQVEPDYSIKIGEYDRTNSLTRYFRVKGPTVETGFALGIPKVLYDTRAKDSVNYGSTSAMFRLYYVNQETGHRFPVNVGVGTFGVSSPIDVDVGRGGFALSMFLDMVEIMRMVDIDVGKKLNVGLELTPFFPLERRSRLLFNAQVSFTF